MLRAGTTKRAKTNPAARTPSCNGVSPTAQSRRHAALTPLKHGGYLAQNKAHSEREATTRCYLPRKDNAMKKKKRIDQGFVQQGARFFLSLKPPARFPRLCPPPDINYETRTLTPPVSPVGP